MLRPAVDAVLQPPKIDVTLRHISSARVPRRWKEASCLAPNAKALVLGAPDQGLHGPWYRGTDSLPRTRFRRCHPSRAGGEPVGRRNTSFRAGGRSSLERLGEWVASPFVDSFWIWMFQYVSICFNMFLLVNMFHLLCFLQDEKACFMFRLRHAFGFSWRKTSLGTDVCAVARTT